MRLWSFTSYGDWCWPKMEFLSPVSSPMRLIEMNLKIIWWYRSTHTTHDTHTYSTHPMSFPNNKKKKKKTWNGYDCVMLMKIYVRQNKNRINKTWYTASECDMCRKMTYLFRLLSGHYVCPIGLYVIDVNGNLFVSKQIDNNNNNKKDRKWERDEKYP